MKLVWQSKLVLLVVVPFAAVNVVLDGRLFFIGSLRVAVWTVGLSALLALVTWKVRAATAGAAVTGAAITASLMFSTATFPYWPWQTALMPLLAVFLISFIATRLGRGLKERLGTAENRRGRSAAQVAANLGVATIASSEMVQSRLMHSHFTHAAFPLFAVGLAALVEAAADTVSSEMGQVYGGRPRMITTLKAAEAGTDGAISLPGTLAGMVAAAVVAATGALALKDGMALFALSCAGGIFGLFFDSLLGATLERRGWLNNDAVNFLSTASAAAFALALLAI